MLSDITPAEKLVLKLWGSPLWAYSEASQEYRDKVVAERTGLTPWRVRRIREAKSLLDHN